MNKSELELCKKALHRVDLEEISYFYSLDFQVPDHTPEFTEKMTALIEKTRKKEASFLLMNFKKILVAAIVAVIIICTIVSCAFAPKILDFFTKIYDDHITLESEKSNIKHIKEYYRPQVLPEEFVQINFTKTALSYIIYYENNTKQLIIYEQDVKGKSITNIDTSNGITEKTLSNGIEIAYCSEKNYYSIIWSTGDYAFYLSCPTSLPWDEVEKIILGIQPIDS